MPSLKQIADGEVNITDVTSISYQGRTYTGKKSIMALANRVVKKQSEASDEQPADKKSTSKKSADEAAKDQS